jgi:hypothetical protein
MSYQANVALAEGKSLKVYYVIIVIGDSTGNVPTPHSMM